MTPFHTRIQELLDTCDEPEIASVYEAFEQARHEIYRLTDPSKRVCLNCGATTDLTHIADSPLSVCGTCLTL